MCQGNIPVESITIEEALRDFLTLITKVKSSERHENQITVLIGHNSATFDVPTLLRNSDENFKDGITDMNVYFADSLHLMKKLIKNKHKALELDSGGYCKPNQSSIYNYLFKEQFDAHDALENVRALRKILFGSQQGGKKNAFVSTAGIPKLITTKNLVTDPS